MPRRIDPAKKHLKSLRKSLALIEQQLANGDTDLDLIQRQTGLIRQIGSLEKRLEKQKQQPAVDRSKFPKRIDNATVRYTLAELETVDIPLPANAPKGYLSAEKLYALTKDALALKVAELERRKACPQVCLDCEHDPCQCGTGPMEAELAQRAEKRETFLHFPVEEQRKLQAEVLKRLGMSPAEIKKHLDELDHPIPRKSVQTPVTVQPVTTPEPITGFFPFSEQELIDGRVAEARRLMAEMYKHYVWFLQSSDPFSATKFNAYRDRLFLIFDELHIADPTDAVKIELTKDKPFLLARLNADDSRRKAFIEAADAVDRQRRMDEQNRKNSQPPLLPDGFTF